MTVPESGDIPVSSADAFRRAALFASGLLALRQSPRLHELLHELAHQASAPIAGVSVIDGQFCWLPVAIGLDVDRLPIAEALCVDERGLPRRAIEPDLLAIPHFAAHPAVAGPIAIRAFAAAPLRGVEGVGLGAVFIADRVARTDFIDCALPILDDAADRIMIEASAPHHLRRMGRSTLDELERLIREATRNGDDELVTAIDRVLRAVLPHTGLRHL
ncbi:hypothetical protein FPZ54_06810 [Sphingomonas suaedae]|uniref:GAF domain-containing protein n=1 Tax=Sphingomonas suaedae TaxID=2599297 RepID=A0A518RE86_9SPHN|nr:hypothetical protein [Sphingomonas suaedae]QDX25758.1 hypothetical protein FPZ54_06810 [Sphingomonas suaedae]